MSYFLFFSIKDEVIVPWNSSGERKLGEKQYSQQCTHYNCTCVLSFLSSSSLSANNGAPDNSFGVLQCCPKVLQGPFYTQKIQIPASWVPSAWEYWGKWYLIFLSWAHLRKDSTVRQKDVMSCLSCFVQYSVGRVTVSPGIKQDEFSLLEATEAFWIFQVKIRCRRPYVSEAKGTRMVSRGVHSANMLEWLPAP